MPYPIALMTVVTIFVQNKVNVLHALDIQHKELHAAPFGSSPNHPPKGTGPNNFESPLETKFASRRL